MPLLPADQPLTVVPRRIVVAGASGAGKTTLASTVAGRLGIPHVEIDGLFHGPGWTPRPSFVADVQALVAQPAWVTEWQYAQARPLLVAAADLMVWLDLGRARALWQVLRRTVHRRRTRAVLWNGNQEPPLHTLLTDPEHVVRWAWSTHPDTAIRVRAALVTRPDLPVVQLTGHASARRWVEGPLAEAALSSGWGRG